MGKEFEGIGIFAVLPESLGGGSVLALGSCEPTSDSSAARVRLSKAMDQGQSCLEGCLSACKIGFCPENSGLRECLWENDDGVVASLYELDLLEPEQIRFLDASPSEFADTPEEVGVRLLGALEKICHDLSPGTFACGVRLLGPDAERNLDVAEEIWDLGVGLRKNTPVPRKMGGFR